MCRQVIAVSQLWGGGGAPKIVITLTPSIPMFLFCPLFIQCDRCLEALCESSWVAKIASHGNCTSKMSYKSKTGGVVHWPAINEAIK